MPFGENDLESVKFLSEQIRRKDAFFSDGKEEFEKVYRGYLPDSLNAFMYGVSGTQAIENAILIAQKESERRKVIYLKGAYYGNSLTLLCGVMKSRKDNAESILIEKKQPYCY